MLFGVLTWTAWSFAAPTDAFAGRWLFQIATKQGELLPIFIVEIAENAGKPKATLLHAQASLDFSIPLFEISSGTMRIDLKTERGTLSFAAKPVSNDLLKGTVNGGAFMDREFLAERTDLDEIGHQKRPTREEQADFARGAVKRDPHERIEGVRAFLRKHSQSDLKVRAYETLFGAYLEIDDDQGLIEAAEAVILNSADRLKAKSDVAMQLAVRSRLLGQAEKYADEALYQSSPDSPDRASYLNSRGWVAMKKNEYADAVRYLREAHTLRPEDGRISILYAEALSATGEQAEALKQYLSAYVQTGSAQAMQILERVYLKDHASLDGLHEKVDAAYREQPQLFDPGKYTGPPPKRVVLVEQFTGSSCMPCQASDYGYEGVAEHYPSQAVIPLSYHLHVPQPDPLANLDSRARGDYYEVHSTPMVFLSGNTKRTGGGNKTAAEQFFKDYKSVIDQQLQRPTSVKIQVDAALDGDVLTYKAHADLGDGPPAKLRLRLALVEGMVHYTGHNGNHFHRNVVRKMLPQPAGIGPAGGAGDSIEISGTQDIGVLEGDLKDYLASYRDANWDSPFGDPQNRIDRGDLRLVAFVQNDETKEVLQAAMVSVSPQ